MNRAFLALRPKLEVAIDCVQGGEQQHALLNRRIDAGFSNVPLGDLRLVQHLIA